MASSASSVTSTTATLIRRRRDNDIKHNYSRSPTGCSTCASYNFLPLVFLSLFIFLFLFSFFDTWNISVSYEISWKAIPRKRGEERIFFYLCLNC